MHVLSAFEMSTRDGAVAGAVLVATVVASAIAEWLLFGTLRKVARSNDSRFALFVNRADGPCRVIFPLIALEVVLPLLTLPETAKLGAEHLLEILIIAAIAWVLVALVQLTNDLVKRRFSFATGDDDVQARQVKTRLDILARAAILIVVFVSVAVALTTFPAIRAIGATLLASAGLVGIAAGFAARPVFENLVAGLQIAIMQPIRIDDVLIVEGEYGRVERIASTYVVVRLWDLRRMILPLTYFIDKPFQNWTYAAANLIGTVMLYVDYSVDIDRLRTELTTILQSTPLWDEKVANVAVTDAKEASIEVRILVSARDSSQLFDLRCLVRERLVAHVRDEHPGGLSSQRLLITPNATPMGPGKAPTTPVPPPA